MTRQSDRILTATMAEPIWKPGRPCDTVDPKAAGWNGDEGQWRLHYRVRTPIIPGNHPSMEQARQHLASLSAERRAELEGPWK